MAQMTSIDNHQLPAMRVMDEAIELAIEGCSPYPKRAAFIDDRGPRTGAAIKRAIDEDRAVVLVSADGSTRTLRAEPAHS
jgi:hypothetical protein